MVATKEEDAVTISSSQLVLSNSLPYLYRGASECSNVDPDEEIYNMDQSDERRFYSLREGKCFVETTVNSKGIFWIKPFTGRSNDFNQRMLSDRIQKVINIKQLLSFSKQQPQRPTINSRCFVYACSSKNKWFFKRGLIEHVYYDRQECDIRFLDKGSKETFSFCHIYPHARLDTQLYTKDETNNNVFHTPKYLGIRCCISSNVVNSSNLQRNLFRLLVFPGHSRFELIEQVLIGNLKCWRTKIYLCDKYKQFEGKCLNSLLYESTEQELNDIEKSFDVKKNRIKKVDSLLVNHLIVDATTTFSSMQAKANNDSLKSIKIFTIIFSKIIITNFYILFYF